MTSPTDDYVSRELRDFAEKVALPAAGFAAILSVFGILSGVLQLVAFIGCAYGTWRLWIRGDRRSATLLAIAALVCFPFAPIPLLILVNLTKVLPFGFSLASYYSGIRVVVFLMGLVILRIAFRVSYDEARPGKRAS